MPTLVMNAVPINLLDAVAHGIQNGTAFALPVKPGLASWSVSFGSAPGASTISLQFSNDGILWTTVDTTTTTAGETRSLSSLTAVFVRAIISAAAGGSTTTVTLLYKGFDGKSSASSQRELLFSSVRQLGNVGAGLETIIAFQVPANKLANNGDAIYIEAAVQLAANANNKLSALTTGATTLASRSAAENNLPRIMSSRVMRTGAATAQAWGTTQAQGQGTLVNLSVPVPDWSTAITFNLVYQGVAANDLINRMFQVWYEPTFGTYQGL